MTGPAEHDPAGDYHREVDDPWDEDYALTGPVEAHGRGLDFGLLLLRLATLPLVLLGARAATDMGAFTAQVSDSLVGSAAPDVVAWGVMVGLVALPVLVVVGLFTRPAGFLLAALLATVWALAVFLGTDRALLVDGEHLTAQSALLFVGLTLPLAFTGAGRLSVDSLRTAGRP
ncbi:hypothetical protein [Serinicoccus sediminis]|uniref:hypothetical protein n=1 Tax=Serinicoccus sediminis TaxID=2306021 RepID=UPI00102194C1|nr:hypothetical protein [Serinicoccus sediminis]